MRRRLLVLAAAVVPVLALVVAIAIVRGGSTSTPAKLPVAFGSGASGGGGTAAAALDAAEPMPARYPYTASHYVAASDLPDLGGAAHAYRVNGAATDAAIASVTHALDVDASALSVRRDTGQWSMPGVAGDIAVASPCFVAPDTSTSSCTPPPTTVPPAPSLSEGDAKARALDVARAAGVDVDAAVTAAQLNGSEWYVTIDPTVDGLPTSGLTTSVAFAADGAVAYASGFIATIEAADTYPRLTTREAIDQLNANQVVPLIAVAPEPGPDGAPTTAPAVRDVSVTAAAPALLYQPTSDGTAGYLVPAYRFTTDDGASPTAIAIDRSWFAPPPVDTTPKSDGGTTNTGSGAPGSVGTAIPPAPANRP